MVEEAETLVYKLGAKLLNLNIHQHFERGVPTKSCKYLFSLISYFLTLYSVIYEVKRIIC